MRAENGCLLYVFGSPNVEYGSFSGDGGKDAAHRVGWEMRHGPIPPDVSVLHRCDTPRCVEHLFLGTQADNVVDMRAKGRGASQRGERNSQARMTAEMVQAVRIMAALGASDLWIAEAVGVSRPQVVNTRVGRRWPTVPLVEVG